MTLDDMIEDIKKLTDTMEDVIKTNGEYIGDALNIVNGFISSLNYAKDKIVKEKFAPDYTDIITLNDTMTVDITTLAKPFLDIVSAKKDNQYHVYYVYLSIQQICFARNSAGDTIYLRYTYIPADLKALTDVLDIPERVLNPKILVYFAAFDYLINSNSPRDINKANRYLQLWNDGYSNIRIPNMDMAPRPLWK